MTLHDPYATFSAWHHFERGTLPRTPNKDDPSVMEAWIPVKPFIGNDAEQLLRQATSTKRAEVDPIGLCRVYTKLLGFGWTVQQIAERSGVPVATIKRALDLASGNTNVHEMVKAGEVKPTLAAAAVRKHGEKAGEVLATQLEQAKKQGKKRVTAAVTKLTFDEWFEQWVGEHPTPDTAELYRAFAQQVWTAARAGR